jgi:hypothetical protein
MAVTQIQIRRGTTAEWISASPVVLASGEPGFDTTLHMHKIGDGTSEWDELPFVESNNTNVISYGATGDGVTDDTTAIQAAIDYVNNSGGVCYVPEGTFIASVLTLKSGVTLMGAGKNITILKQKDGSNQDFIHNSANTDTFYGIKNLTVDGNYTEQSAGAGIVFCGDDVIIDNCEIKNCEMYGVLLCDGNRHNIANCYIHHNTNIGLFVGSADTAIYDVSIFANKIEYNDSHGILIGNTSTTIAQRVHVTNCWLNNNGANDGGGGGVWAVDGSSNVIISGCTVYNNDGDNIGIAGCVGYTVVNNNTFGADGPSWDPANSGIAISAASIYGIVKGNRCYSNSACGIIIRGQSIGLLVALNYCYNNSQHGAGEFSGIQVDTIAPDTDSGDGIIIEANMCFDDQATKLQAYGIKIDTNADSVICKNNMVVGNLTAGILNNAASTDLVRVTDNLGYNPVSVLIAPALSHGVGVVNTFCFPVRVIIDGGVLANVYIQGISVGTSLGMYILQPMENIQVNITSGSPTWVWMGM